MEKSNPVIDQTLFDLKLNEAKFYSDQGLYDEADAIYLNLINTLKQLPETRSSNVQIRQLESMRQEYQTKTEEIKVVIPETSDTMDDLVLDVDDLAMASEDGYIDDESHKDKYVKDSRFSKSRENQYDRIASAKISSKSHLISNTDNQVELFVNEMVVDAYKRGATGIHIEPATNLSHLPADSTRATIRFRIDGSCQPYLEVDNKFALHLIFKIKIMAKMDITMRAEPLYGKIRFKSEQTGAMELRVVTVPTIGSKEDLVIRISPHGATPRTLADLGFLDHTLAPFFDMIHKLSGLIIVAGDSGSGKTTTLHSALKLINSPEKKIWSAENPVEIRQKGIRQTEINISKGIDYPILIKAFISANPDIIMLGEIPEYETAALAIKASLTGHLVLAGFNATDVSETVRRVLEMGVNPIHFADSLLCILAQRLVRRLCNECRKPSLYTLDMLTDQFGEDPLSLLANMDRDNILLYDSNPDGCAHCGYTGYRGLIALHELLINSDAVKLLIKDATCIEQLTKSAAPSQSRFQKIDGAVKKLKSDAAGYRLYTFKQDGILKVMEGVTDMAEIGRRSSY